MPSLRKDHRYNLSDFDSKMLAAGIYLIVMVAKSGCSVMGQRQVNSLVRTVTV